MAFSFKKLRNILTVTTGGQTGSTLLDPELGFKAIINEEAKELKITVIGARHLPTIYGLTRAEGYVVKVKLFPGKEKFETKLQKESWPVFNQDFTFTLNSNSKRVEDMLIGKFVVFTAYAILEHHNDDKEESSIRNNRLSAPAFMNFLSKGELKRSETTRNNRVSLYKRRTIGAVTYNLDLKNFNQRLRNHTIGTPDVWRIVKSISSGLVDNEKNNENNKGSVELTMTYSVSENGQNDMIQLSLSRLRFSISTMEMHENYTGSLYVKMKIYEHDVVVSKWRSDKFEPTISHKLEPTTATMIGTVQSCNLHAVRCEIRLMCKNKVGKKSELGQVVIKQNDGHWEQAHDIPSNSVTLWHNFR